MGKKHIKGQIAIFVVLIFQVLFILFAMTINVAMTVYDKINLQNSLDLAAYYGAKQQAEVLNAMAHINYQMRQNWKLLSWRYRILGTLTQDDGHPHQATPPPPPPNPNDDYWCPQNKDNDTRCHRRYITDTNEKQKCNSANSFYAGRIYDNHCDSRYFICMSSNPWIRGVKSDDQNLCELSEIEIPPIPSPNVPSGPLPVGSIANFAVIRLQNDITVSCPMEGALNALMAHLFLIHFREDQKDRKAMLKAIFDETLKQGKDLDGKDIFETAGKVFCNNLSQTNRKNIFNNDECPSDFQNSPIKHFHSVKESDPKEFNNYFKGMRVYPTLQILDFGSGSYPNGSGSTCPQRIREHYDISQPQRFEKITAEGITNRLNPSSGHHPLGPFLIQNLVKMRKQITELNMEGYFQQGGGADNENKLLLGFYRKPDPSNQKPIPIYYGLKIELDYTPKIFALNFGMPIKFRASSFAKAFGGVFGPSEEADPFISVNIQNIDSQTANPYTLQPNYSRYPGDKWGLTDYQLHDPGAPNRRNTKRFLNKMNKVGTYKRVYTIDAFFLNALYQHQGKARDPLAYPFFSNNQSVDVEKSFMRTMELMAVYPDLFDITHYSISGNYEEAYFQRICNLLKPDGRNDCKTDKPNKFNNNYHIRGDFGWPHSKILDRNTNQSSSSKAALSIAPVFLKGRFDDPSLVEILAHNRDNFNPTNDSNYHNNRRIFKVKGPSFKMGGSSQRGLTGGKLFYPWLAELPTDLLSSWAPPIPDGSGKMDYSEYKNESNDKLFMECISQVEETGKAHPSGCSAGGRSGYSVKLISCETVDTFQQKPHGFDPNSEPWCG